MGTKLIIAVLTTLLSGTAGAANIEDAFHYAWGENVGWLNFDPNDAGVQVSSTMLTGYIWSESIGWISLSCENTSSCASVSFGIVHDGMGNLSGYGWSENTGWINFNPVVPDDPTDYGVRIDAEGTFSGYGWGENIGWVNFNAAQLFGTGVKACKVTLADLTVLTEYWLQSCGPANDYCGGADVMLSNHVDASDFSVLSAFWMDFCPDAWPIRHESHW